MGNGGFREGGPTNIKKLGIPIVKLLGKCLYLIHLLMFLGFELSTTEMLSRIQQEKLDDYIAVIRSSMNASKCT